MHSLTPHFLHVFTSRLTSTYSFSLFLKKIDLFTSLILSITTIQIITSIWPALSVPTTSMLPIANKFSAPIALKTLAKIAIKLSFVPTTSPLHSASSATLFSLILNFNTSVSPSPFFTDISLSTNKIFSSLKNLPCYLPLKPFFFVHIIYNCLDAQYNSQA